MTTKPFERRPPVRSSPPRQALDRGLVEKLGYLEDAVERAAELAGVSPESVRCVEYKKPVTPIESLLGAQAARIGGNDSLDARALLELSTPRAYYFCTLGSALLESR